MFDAAWFAEHQRVWLGLLRMPVIGGELRDALAIRRGDVGWGREIVALLPHAYVVDNGDGTLTADIRTHHKFAKRLRHQYAWIWRAAHEWDRFVANPLVPALNVGFDTLLTYPDPGSGGPGWDLCGETDRSGFLNARNADGFNNGATSQEWAACAMLGTTEFSDGWRVSRGMWGFYIGIPLGTVQAATFSLYHINDSGANSLGIDPEPTYGVFDFTPASATGPNGTTDWAACGSTLLSDDILVGSSIVGNYNQYYSHVLNAAGMAQVGLRNYFICCMREIDYDVAGVAPTWAAQWQYSRLVCYYADRTGSSEDPKLEVTFEPSSPLLPGNILRPRVFAPGRAK